MNAREWFTKARAEGFALRFHSGQNFLSINRRDLL